ncbi:MAG TPA: hypothetical protein VNE16_06505 [Vicinamibacterales bacterium]|nr:hypothetical protein [Vicinamibacterales bacterium]
MKVGQAFRDGLMGGLITLAVLLVAFMMNTLRLSQLPFQWQVVAFIHHWPTLVGMLAIFFVLYGLIGIVYALGFERIVREASPAWGMLFALPHMVFIGYLVGFLPAMGLWPSLLQPGPGLLFMNYFFAGPFVLLFSHFAYGITMGLLYKPVAEPRLG